MLRTITRRPVAVVMFTAAVLLFGMVSLSRLPVTLLPDLSYPTLTVRTELEGAAPTEVETLLSKPIEEVLGVIKNVRQVRSVSRGRASAICSGSVSGVFVTMSCTNASLWRTGPTRSNG